MRLNFSYANNLIRALVFFLFLGALTISQKVVAQEPTPTPSNIVTAPGISMEAFPAFGGNFKYGEWLPVWVEVGNTGPDIHGELRTQVAGSSVMVFTTPLELPTGSRKRLVLYVLPNNFSRRLVIELVSGDTRLASRPVDINPQPTITYLVGLIAPERGPLSAVDDIEIPGTRRPVELVDVALAELPEKFEGLRSFDLLVLTNTDTSELTPGQNLAIESWVRQGGRLVVGGGSQAQSVLAGLPDTLIPIMSLTTLQVDQLPGLEEFVQIDEEQTPRPILIPGPFVAARGEAEGAVTLASQPDLDLVYEWTVDNGWVNLVALDLSGSPFDAWNGTTSFWQRLVAATAVYPEYAAPDMSARQQFAGAITYPLSNLPMLDLPSVKSLALLLGLYILLVGPVNYLVLRRLNQLHLAWITIPALTLVFSAASFGLGFILHGTDIFINKIAVYQLEPSGRARVDSFIGLFSPAQRAYEVQIHDGGLISPLNPYFDPWVSAAPNSTLPEGRRIILIQGNPSQVRGLSVEQWSMQSFMSEGTFVEFGKIEADLRLEGERIVGQVHNQSNVPLMDAALIFGSRFARIGDLPAGESIEVDLDLNIPQGPNQQVFAQPISYAMYEQELSGRDGPPPREIEVRRSIIEILFERTPPYISSKISAGSTPVLPQRPTIIGWVDQAPPEVRLAGDEPAQQTTAIVVAPVDYTLPKTGSISLPPGMIQGRMIVNPTEGGSCGMPGATAVYISRGEAVFEYVLPNDLPAKSVQTFKLNLNTDAGFFNPPNLSIYEWNLSQWLDLEGISQGLNLVPASPTLIGSNGQVWIRLAGENLQYCYFLNFGVDAVR